MKDSLFIFEKFWIKKWESNCSKTKMKQLFHFFYQRHFGIRIALEAINQLNSFWHVWHRENALVQQVTPRPCALLIGGDGQLWKALCSATSCVGVGNPTWMHLILPMLPQVEHVKKNTYHKLKTEHNTHTLTSGAQTDKYPYIRQNNNRI